LAVAVGGVEDVPYIAMEHVLFLVVE